MLATRMENERAVPAATLRQLLTARTLLLACELAGVLLAPAFFALRLPLTPMLAVIVLHAVHNGMSYWRQRAGSVRNSELFLQLAADAFVLAALIYFSGGYANPFISLLLLPVILCAVTIPARFVWAMTTWVAVLYSLLARFYQPLTLEIDSQAAIDLHLAGMWLNFLFTALIVSAFAARLAAALRQRDAELARMREKSLRDEQLFSLGMQAASAAHDLATPLSALHVSLRDLERDYAGDEELSPALTGMRAQADRMRGVLDRLALAAGAARARQTETHDIEDWLRDLLAHWQLMWPQARASLVLQGGSPAPRVRDDPILVSVLAGLLNNAARVSPERIELQADWDRDALRLGVLDRGPGLPVDPVAPSGWGVGLDLARAAIERFGGDLSIAERDGGGLAVRLRLPWSALGGGT